MSPPTRHIFKGYFHSLVQILKHIFCSESLKDESEVLVH